MIDTKNPVFTIERSFDAPRALLWKAWTTPEMMVQWFGPKGFTIFKPTMDFRVGRSYHYGMKSSDGHEVWGKSFYKAIDAPKHLGYVDCFADAEGNIARHPLSPNWPRELMTDIDFGEEGNGTKLIVRWVPMNATPEEIKTFTDSMDGMTQGWSGTFDNLAAFLQTAKAA